jgi:hypothetical protein
MGDGATRSRFRLLSNVAAGAAVAIDLALGAWARAAAAQEAQRVVISVPAVTRAEPSSMTKLSIRVAPQKTLPNNSFIRIRGLPPVVAVSSGYSVAPGAWSVPLAAVPDLKIVVPVGVQEKSDVLIDLVKDDGSVLAEARTVLVIAPASSEHAHHRQVLAAAATTPNLDPSPLAAISKGFDAFLAKREPKTTDQNAGPKSALSSKQKAEMFLARQSRWRQRQSG